MTLNRLFVLSLVILLIGSQIPVTSSAKQPYVKFDQFGDINCEDEMARLDNFAIQLLAEIQLPAATQTKGAIIYYGGKSFRGRLPRRGEAAARAARLKSYLVHRRGVPADRVIVIDGGYREEWQAELWVVKAGMPTPNPTVPASEIKFRKGKVRARDYRCQI